MKININCFTERTIRLFLDELNKILTLYQSKIKQDVIKLINYLPPYHMVKHSRNPVISKINYLQMYNIH
jgi:hypothetical protein